MKTCPSWVEEIQEKAMKFRYCGEFLDDRPPEAMVLPGRYWGYEYRSSAKILYWPLIHIAQGLYPHTG